MRNVQRTINIAAKLVVGEVSNKVGLKSGRIIRIVVVDEVVVSDPGVGVQYRVLKVFVEAAVELFAATLGDDTDLAANGASVLSRVVGRKYLHLLHRIEVRRTDRVSTGADTDGDGAVVSQQVIALTAS